jgi:hypothetical protein
VKTKTELTDKDGRTSPDRTDSTLPDQGMIVVFFHNFVS